MNEIEVIVNQQNGIVNFNFEEIKAQLTAEMEVYRTLVFTEEQKPAAKKDIANLRKLKKAIDDKRKEVKKTFMVPYEEFEKQVKELTSLIDEPIALIDKQVTEFEENQRKEKVQKINELYSEVVADKEVEVPLHKIYKKEWENITTSMKSIKQDMEDALFRIKTDLETIEGFGSDAGDRAKEMYMQNGYSLAPCIQHIQQYEQQKKEFEEKERIRREQERLAEEKRKHDEEIARLEREKAEEIARLEQEKAAGQEEPQETVEEPQGFTFNEEPQGFDFPTEPQGFALDEEPQGFVFDEEPKKTVSFTVTGTDSEIQTLRDYISYIFKDFEEREE